mmetsp:Transcript_1862/g.5125  ORF Transcript_1862/g.5125 Transcript_1862/m.5125 type:complete len:217 (-) Transcript_1862:125-775(-)
MVEHLIAVSLVAQPLVKLFWRQACSGDQPIHDGCLHIILRHQLAVHQHHSVLVQVRELIPNLLHVEIGLDVEFRGRQRAGLRRFVVPHAALDHQLVNSQGHHLRVRLGLQRCLQGRQLLRCLHAFSQALGHGVDELFRRLPHAFLQRQLWLGRHGGGKVGTEVGEQSRACGGLHQRLRWSERHLGCLRQDALNVSAFAADGMCHLERRRRVGAKPG